ncbi:MAG: AAA family ATPase [bacterium]|nr:AAA family ATPase [bacterium]
MITRIYISGYKSLREAEIRDLSRLVVLFGPNAAGKSNFLDALDLLAHLAGDDTIAAAFHRHRGNRQERPSPIHWFFHGFDGPEPENELIFEVDLDLHGRIMDQLNRELESREQEAELKRPYTRVTRSKLRYRLILRYSKAARTLNVHHESLVPLRKDGTPHESIAPYIRHDEGSGRISVKIERQAHPRFYDLPRRRTLLSEIGDAVNHPHLVAAARELRSLRVYYVEPLRMRESVNDVEATDPGSHGENLASFYHWLRREHDLAFKNLIHNLGRIIPGIRELSVKEGVEGFLELWISEANRGEFPAALVSEGTLRLLCVLGIAATPAPPSLVGYEEPENGVNPARLREMLSILENAADSATGTQFILTTHSPAVIDALHGAIKILCEQSDGGSRYTPGHASRSG